LIIKDISRDCLIRKRKYVEYRINSIIKKYNEHYNESLETDVVNYFIRTIPVDKYENMRDINKKIKMEFVKYIENVKSSQQNKGILTPNVLNILL